MKPFDENYGLSAWQQQQRLKTCHQPKQEGSGTQGLLQQGCAIREQSSHLWGSGDHS